VSARWSDQTAVVVVMASGGYPGSYEKGKLISGLRAAGEVSGVQVFHAGTSDSDGEVYTAGGRVLGVTAVGRDFGEARERVYEAVARVHFDDMYFRRDIGWRVMEG
jgi:phosphoribosylamine--glycine ligase